MRLESINAVNFRNLSDVMLTPSPHTNVLHGSNGSGKTNLLEAVFVALLGRSHRGAADQVMVHEGQEVYRITATLSGDSGTVEVAVAYQRGGRKKITLDGAPARLSDLYERFSVVSIGPEDSEIISGGPSVRRFFIDLYLSQRSPRYINLLNDYQRALAQKNAALKSESDCTPFDELLVKTGSVIIRQRREFINAVSTVAGKCYADFSDGSTLALDYQPALSNWSDDIDDDKIAERFAEAIRIAHNRERAVQAAMVGPHRDDIRIQIDRYPARTHSSQGEWRTAAIALKLAVYDLLSETRGMRPVLLLDEIFAELDPQRTARLVKSFDALGQLFLTTADGPPEQLRAESRSFQIAQGAIVEMR
jgi:DNA replication and repair protein RecF